jgi:hypothetical protein
MRAGLLMVRAIATDGVHRWPLVGLEWTVQPQSGGWVELVHESGTRLASYIANTNAAGDRGLFLVLGPRAVLDEIAAAMDLAAPLSVAWNAAQAGPGTARDVMRRWRDWRFDGRRRLPDGTVETFTNRAYRLMVAEGSSLPDPSVNALPWNLDRNGGITTVGLAVYRVEAIVRPALLVTMAAPFDDAADAEATE